VIWWLKNGVSISSRGRDETKYSSFSSRGKEEGLLVGFGGDPTSRDLEE